ncbi:MAG TPA: sigma 54-interacting transcriptional regulator, partial [Anaeromyxobacteraceae bacterium]
MRKVLIVDDEPSVRFVLARTCERAGVPFEEASSAEEAREKLGHDGLAKDGVGLVLLDVRLPGDDGFTLLGELAQRPNAPFVVVMTAEDTMRSAVEAMKRGAADYLGKPFDLNRVERLVRDLSTGPENEPGRPPEPAPAVARPGGEPAPQALALGDMLIGRSPALVEVYKEIGRVARTEMTVLLMGESGTGKELVARAIHVNSGRARGPFVTVNMAAIPRDLMESELYGHEKGS